VSTRGLFPELNQPDRDSDHSSKSSVNVRNVHVHVNVNVTCSSPLTLSPWEPSSRIAGNEIPPGRLDRAGSASALQAERPGFISGQETVPRVFRLSSVTAVIQFRPRPLTHVFQSGNH
jgi:hypothetical protein